MKKLGIITMMVMAGSLMAADGQAPADGFAEAVFSKSQAPSLVSKSIAGNQNLSSISQCEQDCLNEFRSCIQNAQGVFEWLACEAAYESCASNCN